MKKRYNNRPAKDFLKRTATQLIEIFTAEDFYGFSGYRCEVCKKTVNVNYEPDKEIWFCECSHANKFDGKGPEHNKPDYGPRNSELKIIDKITGQRTTNYWDDCLFEESEDDDILSIHKRNKHGHILKFKSEREIKAHKTFNNSSGLILDKYGDAYNKIGIRNSIITLSSQKYLRNMDLRLKSTTKYSRIKRKRKK